MSWATREGVDYDDAKRPTADDPTHATGWVAYYCWGRGGGGCYTPHYRFMPGEWTHEDLREHIESAWEDWMRDAEQASIVIHRGVTPPLKAVEGLLVSAIEGLKSAQAWVEQVQAQVKLYLGAETARACPHHRQQVFIVSGTTTCAYCGEKVAPL